MEQARKLLVATHNRGKIREYRELLADLPLQVTYLDAEGITVEVVETGATFHDNALLKATSYARLTGLWTWADDSGLEVDALAGRPGVLSARYGGPGLSDRDRYLKLLGELAGVPDHERTARFHCVVAIALPDGRTGTADGAVEGVILRAPRGEQGFGYDPVFYVPDRQSTMAELPSEVKNAISHRGLAAQRAKTLLQELLATGEFPGQLSNQASSSADTP
jgi:XTP/dITP diphosphohydrolase